MVRTHPLLPPPLPSPVVLRTERALIFKLIIETALMEGVLAEEVDGGWRQPSLAQTALHHLEDLRTKRE